MISNLLKGLCSRLVWVLWKQGQDCAVTRLQAGGSLTCLLSCAGLSKVGMLGTAILRLGSHRVLVAGRTGGKPCYTHHTESACHPHLGKCSSLVTRPQPHSTQEAEAVAVLEGRTKQEKDARSPMRAGTLSLMVFLGGPSFCPTTIFMNSSI